MTQTNCARCLARLGRRELLRESLLCNDCERLLLTPNVEWEELRQLPLDDLDLGGLRSQRSDRTFD